MGGSGADAESEVSGNQANIATWIRHELDIDDGDLLRWYLDEDDSVRIEVVHQREGTFADFDGYDGDRDTDVTAEHDAWGVTADQA